MSFENTREVLGERATLDGLIDGTLETFMDDCSDTVSNTCLIIPHNTGLKTIVLPFFVLSDFNSNKGMFSSTDPRYVDSTGAIPGVETVVMRTKGSPQTASWFKHCENLKAIDLSFASGTSGFGSYLFTYCKNLKTLIIRNTSRMNLSQTGAFTNTPFASGGSGGTLYVPQALVSSYQSATNWSTILGYENNSILPIEGSAYDGFYADGTPMD